jgi:hypothetical protein
MNTMSSSVAMMHFRFDRQREDVPIARMAFASGGAGVLGPADRSHANRWR